MKQGNLTLQRFVIEEEMFEEDSERIDDAAKEAQRFNFMPHFGGSTSKDRPIIAEKNSTVNPLANQEH